MNPTIHRNPINLLRALAVLLVFCHHYMHYAKTNLGLIGTYGGLLGVQLFFLISGYLIVKTASLHSLPIFLRGRVLRIFPTYWFVLLFASWFYQPVLPFTAADAPYFWFNFFALSHFSPYALVKFDVLTVSWTLTIEWTWYLIAPALLALGSNTVVKARTGGHFWAWVLLLMVLLQVGWFMAVRAGWLDSFFAGPIAKVGISPINDHMRIAFMYYAAPAQLVFFVIGACIWAYEDVLIKIKPIYWFVLSTSVVALPSLWLLGIRLDPSFVSGLGLAGLFVFALQNARPLSHPLLRPLHWVGDWSFGLYLLHVPVILAAIRHYKVSGASGFMACLAVSLALSCFVHWLVERPSRQLNRML
jgi:exopolysaccharide production protein ExoZ